MEEQTCPRCRFTALPQEFGRLNNEDQLRCVTVYRCPTCGHLFAPVPEAILEAYQREVLGVKSL